MTKPPIAVIIMIALFNITLFVKDAPALDAPHNTSKQSWSITCSRCHYSVTGPLPSWATMPTTSDNTFKNNLCKDCHSASGMPGADPRYTDVKTHSALQTGSSYWSGNWTVECVTCHNPHFQQQTTNPAYSSEPGVNILTGTTSAIATSFGAATSSLTDTAASFPPNGFVGYLLVPNIVTPSRIYRINGNTSTTLTVDGAINPNYAAPGRTYAIRYGKMVNYQVETTSNGLQNVKFFRNEGVQSFATSTTSPVTSVCQICHTQTSSFTNSGILEGPGHPQNTAGTNCTACHSHATGFVHGGGSTGSGCGTSTTCHGTVRSHTTHVSGQILSLDCSECHNTSAFPSFKDGATTKADTTVCANCHSTNGVALAKQYWSSPGSSSQTPGSWSVVEGEKSFCGSCHDSTPGTTRGDGTGDTARNIIGDDATYGFYVTGHGKSSGNYAKLSYQESGGSGNPAANLQSCTGCHSSGFVDPVFSTPCGACHNLASAHFNTPAKRIQTGMENDQSNTNCRRCHSSDSSEGTAATDPPHFYVTSARYESSVHKDKLCTECHDIHGAAGNYAAMTVANKENLCNNCHAGHAGHALHVSFGKSGKTYSLECISCHNVHLVTGLTSATNPNVSAMTLFTNNTSVWGDDANEKMNSYAGSGKYAVPTGDTMNGAMMPDYPTFCLDCHSTPMSEFGRHGGITWNDDNHGLVPSNVPNGGGSSPNWYTFGVAAGWDGDDRTGTQAESWPVLPRGRGEQIWTRSTYTQEERIAGANFVMSCNDCHVTHESGIGAKIRPTVNGAPGSTSHNVMCNACHYYYSDWHAGMSCGNAGCHNAGCWNERICQNQNSIHGIYHATGDSSTRTWNGNMVLDMKFENNLNDSGSFRLHSKWTSTVGSFAAGKVGQAAVFGEDTGVQVGTTNSYWSTDEGYHGTWKYTEMKYNTTLEAWVYPTDNAKSEYTIFNKHTGVSNNGGYALTLKKVNGTLRATFTMSADNNGFAQDGRAGLRGAYSSVAVPLNKWTHVAVTFDTNGPDRNPADPSIGRIRIYVNGEDVTTSDASGNWMQPGTNETSIYAFSENSPWNQGICYNGSWCASEFSIGGFDWETSNFLGRMDEAKVWNSTKDAAYFGSYDAQAGPYISHVEGLIGGDQLTVRFSEGVYTNTGSSGALVPGDFILTDAGGNNPRTITGVTHTAGSTTAVLTLSAPLAVADVNADTVAAVANAIYDDNNLATGTEAAIIGLSSQCPTSPVSIQLNEPSGSTYVMDAQAILYGAVYGGAATLTGGEYSGGGDGSGRYILFDYNTSCLQASTAMTIETRIKPTGLAGTGNYIRRILARDGGGNFQISVWRNNAAYPGLYNAPPGEVSIALWIYPADSHSGNAWKPVLTNYTGAKTGSENDCPIVSDHWYLAKAVWNTNKSGGTPGQFFQPADIYIDDQGTDGAGAGENWSGLINCTDTDQSLKTDMVKFYTGDVINAYSGDNFAIGANRSNPANNLFNGLIDWITWKDSAE